MESKLLPKLKSCPWCPKKKSNPYVKYDRSTDDAWQVECGYCCGSAATGYTREEAVTAWNTRADSNDKLREALQEAFEKILEAIETKEMLTAKVFTKAGLNLIKNQH